MYLPIRSTGARIARGIGIVACLMTCAETVAQPSLPTALKEALDTSVKALDSGVTLTWRVERGSSHPLPEVLKGAGEDAIAMSFLKPQTGMYRWRDKSFYMRYEFSQDTLNDKGQPESVQTNTIENSYNGRIYGIGSPPRESYGGTLILDPAGKLAYEDSNSAQLIARTDFLGTVGFRIPRFLGECGQPLKATLLDLLENGGKIEAVEEDQLDNVAVLRVDLEAQGDDHSFFFDPAHGYALRRREIRNGGKLKSVLTTEDLFELRGTWIPKTSLTRHLRYYKSDFYPEDAPLFWERYSAEISKEPLSEDDFVISYTTPGVYVADGTLPEAVHSPHGRVQYYIPANPADLEETIRRAAEKVTAVPAQRPLSRVFLIVAINAIVLIIIAALVVFYRNRRS